MGPQRRGRGGALSHRAPLDSLVYFVGARDRRMPKSRVRFANLPNDTVYHTFCFLGSRDLAVVSCVCREFFYTAGETAVASFLRIFGGVQPSNMPRMTIFRMVQKARTPTVSNTKDLLLWASNHGYPRMLTSLISSGAEEWNPKLLNTRRAADGATPLLLACEQGHLDLVKMLVQHGCDLSRTTQDGSCPLHLAARNGHTAIVRHLVGELHVPVDTVNADGETALMLAVCEGRLSVVKFLLESGADANLATVPKADSGGLTVLIMAAERGHIKALRLLLKHGADVDVANAQGRTALLVASECGHAGIVGALVDSGAAMDVQTNSGKAPLFAAAENGHADVVEILVEAGAPVNQATFRNKIPLYTAAEQGFESIVRLLLPRTTKQDLFTETTYGTTPLFIASKQRNQTIKDLLVDFCLQFDKEAKKRRIAQARAKRQMSASRDGEGGPSALLALGIDITSEKTSCSSQKGTSGGVECPVGSREHREQLGLQHIINSSSRRLHDNATASSQTERVAAHIYQFSAEDASLARKDAAPLFRRLVGGGLQTSTEGGRWGPRQSLGSGGTVSHSYDGSVSDSANAPGAPSNDSQCSVVRPATAGNSASGNGSDNDSSKIGLLAGGSEFAARAEGGSIASAKVAPKPRGPGGDPNGRVVRRASRAMMHEAVDMFAMSAGGTPADGKNVTEQERARKAEMVARARQRREEKRKRQEALMDEQHKIDHAEEQKIRSQRDQLEQDLAERRKLHKASVGDEFFSGISDSSERGEKAAQSLCAQKGDEGSQSIENNGGAEKSAVAKDHRPSFSNFVRRQEERLSKKKERMDAIIAKHLGADADAAPPTKPARTRRRGKGVAGTLSGREDISSATPNVERVSYSEHNHCDENGDDDFDVSILAAQRDHMSLLSRPKGDRVKESLSPPPPPVPPREARSASTRDDIAPRHSAELAGWGDSDDENPVDLCLGAGSFQELGYGAKETKRVEDSAPNVGVSSFDADAIEAAPKHDPQKFPTTIRERLNARKGREGMNAKDAQDRTATHARDDRFRQHAEVVANLRRRRAAQGVGTAVARNKTEQAVRDAATASATAAAAAAAPSKQVLRASVVSLGDDLPF